MNEPRPKWTIAHPSSQFLYEKKEPDFVWQTMHYGLRPFGEQ